MSEIRRWSVLKYGIASSIRVYSVEVVECKNLFKGGDQKRMADIFRRI